MPKPNAELMIIMPTETYEDRLRTVAEFLETPPATDDYVARLAAQVAHAEGPGLYNPSLETDVYALVDLLLEICNKLKKARDDIKGLDDRVKALETA